MATQSGDAAGRMWPSLAVSGEATLPHLQRGTTLPERLLPLGLGWLARVDTRSCVQERGQGPRRRLEPPRTLDVPGRRWRRRPLPSVATMRRALLVCALLLTALLLAACGDN